MNEEFKAWLETRPQCIRDAAALYPPGICFPIDGTPYYVISYAEAKGEFSGVHASTTDPRDDYQTALATREFICIHTLNDALMHVAIDKLQRVIGGPVQ